MVFKRVLGCHCTAVSWSQGHLDGRVLTKRQHLIFTLIFCNITSETNKLRLNPTYRWETARKFGSLRSRSCWTIGSRPGTSKYLPTLIPSSPCSAWPPPWRNSPGFSNMSSSLPREQVEIFNSLINTLFLAALQPYKSSCPPWSR